MSTSSSGGTAVKEDYSTIASLRQLQVRMEQAFSTGSVPVEKEIEMRFLISERLVRIYQESEDEQSAHDAITHLDVILRKASQTLPEYPKFLVVLCQVRISQYLTNGSTHALDMAIEAGRKALLLANTKEPQSKESEIHLDIFQHLGTALSRRHGLSTDLKDIDDAILYTRMAYEGADPSSERRSLLLNNLVSQINRRIRQEHDHDMKIEGEALLKELETRTKAGTVEYGITLVQKFNSTGSLNDLDNAIEHTTAGFNSLPIGHPNRVDGLVAINSMYKLRQNLKKDISNLKHLSESSPEILGNGITQLSGYLNGSHPFPERNQCAAILSDLMGHQYMVTKSLSHLQSLVHFMETMIAEMISKAGQTQSSEHPLSLNWVRAFKKDLDLLISKSVMGNEMAQLAENELDEKYMSHYMPEKPARIILEEVYKSYGTRLQIITDAIERSQILSDEEIGLRVERLGAQNKSQSQDMTSLNVQSKRYEAFGKKTLGIDDETGNIMVDFNEDWVKELFGIHQDELTSLPREQFIFRESMLEQNAIKNAQAEGRQPNLDLCRMCRDVAKHLQRTETGYQLAASTVASLIFGNKFQLICRQHCAICRLVLSCIMSSSGEVHPRLQAIDSDVQGTRVLTGILSSGEKVLRIEYGSTHVGDIRIIYSVNHTTAVRQAWEIKDLELLQHDIITGQGPISSATGQQVNPDLINAWLKNCEENHGEACHANESTVNDEQMSMLFIDVVEKRLVVGTSLDKYFALSYVWGQVDMLKTLKDNYQSRQKPGSLSDVPFPKTIKDAMSLIEALGERFLWVDAICMIQDEKEQMARDIPRMDKVYGRAFATIVALHGDSADAGLPGVSQGSRRPQQIQRLRVSMESTDLDYDPEDGNFDTICLTVTPRQLNMQLDVAKWNTRGWIFQENLLSRRCLFFSSEAVYFRCPTEIVTENGLNEDYMVKFLDSIVERPKMASKPDSRDNPLDQLPSLKSLPTEERLVKISQMYMGLVESYTRREFSFKSDILNGFAGVFSVLDKHLDGKIYVGLPAMLFAHALLWAPAQRIPRRGMRLPTPDDYSMGKPDMQFPSWSWAGWDGPVDYRLFSIGQQDGQLPAPIISHCQVGEERLENVGTTSQKDVLDLVKRWSEQSLVSQPCSDNDTATETVTHMPQTSSPKGKEPEIESKSGKTHGTLRFQPDTARGTVWTIAPPQQLERWDDPLESNTLRFIAPLVPISAFVIAPEKEYLTDLNHLYVQSNQAIRRIYDNRGHHCGVWWEQAGYGYVGLSMESKSESRIWMAGISAYEETDHRYKGLKRVEGDIDYFDANAFPAVGPGSGLVNVLVIIGDRNKANLEGHRVTVVVMHTKAWSAREPAVSRIVLN